MSGFPDAILNKTAGWRDVLTLLIVALLPWQGRFIRSYGELGGVPWEGATCGLYATELLLLSALILHFLSVASGRRVKVKTPPWLRFWTLLIFFALLSIVWAPRPEAAFISWIHLFEGFALAYLIWISGRPLVHFVYALVAGGVMNALLASWQFLTQSSSASTWLGIAAHSTSEPGVSVIETGTGRFLRAYGLSPHPNILGGYLAVSLFAAVMLYLDGTRRWTRPALFGAVTIMLFGLAFSFSRSAWLAYGVVLVFGFVLCYRNMEEDQKLRVRKIIALHVIVTALVLAFAAPIVMTRLGGGTRLERISFDERSLAAYRGLELVKTHYAVGVGIGNMPAAAFEEVLPRGDAYSYQSAHHVGLLIAVELGFFGFMMLFGSVVVWLADLKRLLSSAAIPLVYGMALLPLILVIAGCFDHYPVSLYAGTLLTGTVFGLFLKAGSSESPSEDA